MQAIRPFDRPNPSAGGRLLAALVRAATGAPSEPRRQALGVAAATAGTASRQPLLLLVVAFCLMALPAPRAEAQLQRFADVAPGDFAFTFIQTLADSGVTGGCGGGNYCPGNTVTRAQMAVFLERGMRGSGYVPPPATGTRFVDVAAGSFAAAFIEQLFADGITGGCGGGAYCPNNSVTRAQMAVFLMRARYGAGFNPPPATGIFSDVAPGSFGANFIERLFADGITGGCGGGRYCPNRAVTRAEMAVFLVRTFNLVLTPPAATALTPVDGATNVELEDIVTATFSERIAAGSVNGATFSLSQAGNPVAARVILDSVNNRAKLGTARTLSLLTEYTATLTGGITDLTGNPLPTTSWTFTSRDGAWLPAAEPVDEFSIGLTRDPQVAVSANGSAIAVWEQAAGNRNDVWANRYEPARGWGVPELVERDDAFPASDPQVAMDDAGNAIVVWLRGDGFFAASIWASRYVAGSGWGVPQALENEAEGAFNQRVASDAAGNAIAVWEQSDGSGVPSIWANRYVPGSGWTGREPLESDVDSYAYSPEIAINDAGIAFVVWEQEDDSPDFITGIWSNRYVPGSGWDGARLVETNSAEFAYIPQVAVDAAGNATAVWLQEDNSEDFITHVWANRFGPDASVRIYRYTGAAFNVVSGSRFGATDSVTGTFTIDCAAAGGAGDCSSLPFGDYAAAVTSCSFTASGNPELTITCADALPGYFFRLQTDAGGLLSASYNIAFESSLEGGNGARIVMNNNGGFTVARPGAAGGEGRVDYQAGSWTVATGGSWGSAALLETDNLNYADSPQVAVGGDGNAFAIWTQEDDSLTSPNTGLPISNMWVNRYVPGSGWSGPALIEADSTTDAFDPEIAVDDAGNAIAVWETRLGVQNTISANRYIAGSGWVGPTTIGDASAFDPRIAADVLGNMIAVWEREPAGGNDRIFFNRFGGGGERNGGLIAETLFSDPFLAACVNAAAAANAWHFAQEVTELDCSNDGIRSLGGLQTFVNLEVLDLSGNQLDDLSAIEKFPELRELRLANNPGLTDVEALLSRSQLLQVDLGGSGSGALDCGVLDALTDGGVSVIRPATCRQRIANATFVDAQLQACVQAAAASEQVTFVDELRVLDCERRPGIGLIQVLDGIDILENLEAINIDRSNVQDLGPLAGLSRLRRLDASSTFISTLAPLAAAPALEVLTLKSIPRLYNDIASGQDPTGISILAGMPSLREAYLNEKDYCPAQRQCVTGGGRMDCETLDALESSLDRFVRPQSCNMPIANVQFAPEGTLRQCVLAEAASIGITDTDELIVLGCPNQGITDVRGLERFGSVISLLLDGNPVQDLTPVNGIRTLRFLYLNNTAIPDFSALSDLVLLDDLQAQNVAALTDISELLRMTRLTRVLLDNSGQGQMECADLDRLEAIVGAANLGRPACVGGPPTPPFEGRFADMNNDGGDDLVLELDAASGAAVTSGWSSLLAGGGQFNTGTLLQGLPTATYSRARAVALGDANNDGFDDVLLQLDSATDDSVSWRAQLADGGGGIAASTGSTTLPSGKLNNAQAIGFEDVNNDGFADILLQEQLDVDLFGSPFPVVNYYLSLGNGSGFAAPNLLYSFDLEQGRPRIVALEDVNDDDTADIVYAIDRGSSNGSNGYCFGVRTWRPGLGFRPDSGANVCYPLSVGPRIFLDAASVADIDGNGRKELVLSFSNEGDFSFGDLAHIVGTVTFSENGGNTTWTNFASYFAETPAPGTVQEYETIAVADINNDRRSDVIVEVTDAAGFKDWIGYVAAPDGGGGVGFQRQGPVMTRPAGSTGYLPLGLLDYDNDPSSRPDLLFARRDSGTGNFQLLVATNSGGFFSSPTLWYQLDGGPDVKPRIIGIGEDGLTTLANDTSELIAWVGVGDLRYTRQQFSDLLAAKGLDLNVGADLDPSVPLAQGSCVINYSQAGTSVDVSGGLVTDVGAQAEFGMLVCNVMIGDRLSLRTQAIYGGCDATTGLGGTSASCEVGLASAELEIDLTLIDGIPASQTLAVKGPNASACGGVSTKNVCASVGAELASVSQSVEVVGVGAGAKLAVGVGAGADMAIEDGVISGSIELSFIVGGSIEWSLDPEETGMFFFKAGKTSYTYADTAGRFIVFTAGPAVYDAASRLGGALEDEAGKAGKVALTEAGKAVYFVAGEEGRQAFVLFTDTAGRAIGETFDALESAASTAVNATAGVFVDIGNGLADGAAQIWDWL